MAGCSSLQISGLRLPACRYQTYSGGDYRGNECMRQSFEPLYYQYGVDMQFNGASELSIKNRHDVSNQHKYCNSVF